MRADGDGQALEEAGRILRASSPDRVRFGYRLAPLTSFRLGGPAAIYLEAESTDDLTAVARALREAEVPLLVIGKGSNMLVSDDGFPGV
ncbi:MAG: hypothetical protein ACRDHB_07875, partial [Actinomycetota bacterium]